MKPSRESRTFWREGRKHPPFGAPGNEFNLSGLRQGMATQQEPADENVTCRRLQIDGMPCEWVVAPAADPDVRLLYLHGGGYVSGSGANDLPLAADIPAAAGCAVLLEKGMRTAPRGNVRWESVACLLLLVCTGTSLGSPTISWSGERNVPITYPSNVSFDWDANGITDLLMEMTRQPADLFVEAFDENRTPVTDDMEAASLPMAEGTSIGPYLDIGGVSWAAGRHEMAGLRDVDGQVIGGGYWAYVDRGFMGLEFRMGDEIHYGWARISVFTPGLGDNAFALVHDWAYETIPGQSILAGSVPEPSTMALAILGGAVVLAWKVIMRSKVQGSGVL